MRRFELKGITWNHSRALPPLVATAQRFEEMNPTVRIHWEKRSLHEFGHAGLPELTRQYDLLVVDHPMMGAAAVEDVLRDLRLLLNQDEWTDMAEDWRAHRSQAMCMRTSCSRCRSMHPHPRQASGLTCWHTLAILCLRIGASYWNFVAMDW